MVRSNSKINIKDDWAKRIWRDTVGEAKTARAEIDRAIQKIETQLLAPTETEFGIYVVSTEALATFNARSAIQQFQVSNLTDGWQLVATALSYHLSSFKIAYSMRFPNGSSSDLNTASLLYCTAIVLKSRDAGEFLARFIYEVSLNTKSKLRPDFPDAFQTLCYQFSAETCGEKPTHEWREQLDSSLYGPLLRSGSIDEAQQAIIELAIDRGTLCSELFVDYPPFEWPPYSLFPIDILAILLMRHSDQVEFNFGCLESPLCHPPAELSWEKPELIARIENRVREKYEIPDVDWE